MLVVNSIEKFDSKVPSILSIGTFDGVHLGHEKIFERMLEEGENQKKVVITFIRSPQGLLLNNKDKQLISYDAKLELLKKNKVDVVIALQFSDSFSSLSYKDFITYLKTKVNFHRLILGKEAAFGHKKEGVEKTVKSLESSLNFEAIYIPKLKQNNIEISTSTIKSLIQKGDLSLASQMLGRPFEITPSEKEMIVSQKLSALLIDLDDIVLPPSGKYLFKINGSDLFFEGDIKNTQIEIRANDKINLDFKINCSITIHQCP